MKRILGMMGLLLSLTAWADPECEYRLTLSNATVQVLETSQVVELTASLYRGRDTSDSSRCDNYRIFFSKGLANSYQRRAYTILGQYLNYNLHRNNNQTGILKDFGDAINVNEFLDGTSPNRNTTYTQKFYVAVPGLSSTTSKGIYVDNIQASVYAFKPNSGKYIYEDSTSFTAYFYIPSNIDVSLVDEGGTFDASATSKVIDFGNLEKDQQKGVDLRVVSNSSYKVRLSSANGSKLKGPGTSVVNYSLKVNGGSVSLPANTAVEMGSGWATTSAGDKYNLKFQIMDDTKNLQSGLYQDNITITAIAN
ncbi:hypothetical protein [Peredibacter starrii]|uniref:Spore coat protein U domain-containing protein n=1 Tax=Peredibacter starrii TaxID=28202 RepID=A0AAX4HLB3_9BACT|nr:hypothetical protein [Peredibacter starrii]WPU63918.1 hypothetical protein SOO65_14580 [Peredibacter starrii]